MLKIGLSAILVITVNYSIATGQDGSNIVYVSLEQLDESFIGKYCHVDFGSLSFNSNSIDSLELLVNNQSVTFYEHRVDNGFNNWFDQQYLAFVKKFNGLEIRLERSRIDSMSESTIYVTSTLGYYHINSPIDTITAVNHSFEKNAIAKILIKK